MTRHFYFTRNFSLVFVLGFVGQILIFVGNVYLANVLGPSSFGILTYAQTMVLYFAVIADSGLQTIGTRRVAQPNEQAPVVLREILTLRMLLSFAVYALLIPFSLFIIPSAAEQSLTLVVGLSVFPLAFLLEWFFQGLERFAIVVVSRLVRGITYLGLLTLFVHTNTDAMRSAIVFVASYCLPTLILLWLSRRWHSAGGRKTVNLSLLVLALPIGLSALLNQVNFNFGTLAVGMFHTHVAVGEYSAANRIILFVESFIATNVVVVLLPLLSRKFKESTSNFTSLVRYLIRMALLVALPIGISVTLLAASLLHVLYPVGYDDAIPVFQISIWAAMIVLVRSIYDTCLIAIEKQRQFLASALIGAGINIALNVLLVPHYGISGAAYASVGTELSMFVYVFSVTSFHHLGDLLRDVAKPLASCAVMALFLLAFHLSLPLQIVIGVAVYGLALYLVGGLRELKFGGAL